MAKEQTVRIRMRTSWAGSLPQTKEEKKRGEPAPGFCLEAGEDYTVPASLAKLLLEEPAGDPRAEPAPPPREIVFEQRG